MSDKPIDTGEAQKPLPVASDEIMRQVTECFQIESSSIESGALVYRLRQPQETKKPFLRLLEKLDTLGLIAMLRRESGDVILRVTAKPSVKPSNLTLNWVLFLATIATTFVTGYMLSPGLINPFIGGAAFSVAMFAVLGLHEMGHKIAARRKGMESTLPYFIPGPPPFGTFGAVIMQKSLPRNRDALFDVGADGPLLGFAVSIVVSIVGLTMLVPSPPVENAGGIGIPVIWSLLSYAMSGVGLIPQPPPGGVLLVHPVAFAGWVGILVTMLQLLPAAMLDGGHVARSAVGERVRLVLNALSIIFLVVETFYVQAVLVMLMSLYRHPGSLDDVSGLSTGRKLLAVGLIGVFVLCIFPTSLFV